MTTGAGTMCETRVVVSGMVGLALAVWSVQAHAYIDPGSGGFVLQMLLAALAAGGVWIGAKWRMLVQFARNLLVRRRRGPDDTD